MSDRAFAKVQAQQKMLIGSSPKSTLLQRTFVCGGSPGIDRLSTECRNKRLTLQGSRGGFEAPLASAAAQDTSPAWEIVTSSSDVVERASHFGHDFSRLPVYYSPRLPVIQTKLTINKPGDVYEQEADQVAEQVMRTTDQQTSVSDDKDEAKNSLTRKQSAEPRANAATGPSDVPPLVHAVLNSGGGHPLDTTTRAFMEPRFGHDFSQVRVHTDERAAESARSVNALAYTVGKDVVFGAGQYNPRTSVGQRLLAHELTHVAQQEHVGRQSRGEDLPISRPDEPAELEATVVARAVSAAMFRHPLGLPVLPTPIRHHIAGLRINRQRPASSGTRPSARDVVLEFVPDEKMEGGEPLGVIHVKVKGAEVATFPARGGPPSSGPDPDAPGHSFGPTSTGMYTLGRGRPHISKVWPFSQIADGTPLREVATRTGSDVQFKRGGRWVSTQTLRTKLSRADIITAEENLHGSRPGRIPVVWDLNDFGKIAFWIKGTQDFVHTTSETEFAQTTGSAEVLDFSHGCVHIKPTDRDEMKAKGFLQGGVKLKVHAYRTRGLWGTPP